MSIRLRVTAEELRTAASGIQSAAASVRSSFSAADEAVMSCSSFWEGEAAEKHRNDYMKARERAFEAVKDLEEHPGRLLRMAGVYTEAEQEAGNLASELSNDVIGN
ncbi:MAG: WXG100 family type VII secretion target [Blautia sp.]|nr:WXG100 family type VII secretion target [Blautia sp.]